MTEIAIPFGVDSSGAIAVVTDPVAAAAQHLVTFVGTSPRERVMRPQFGSPAQRFLFEPINTLDTALLQSDLASEVAQNVLDVRLNGITINPSATGNPQDGAIGISMQFSLASNPALAADTSGEVYVVIGGGSA